MTRCLGCGRRIARGPRCGREQCKLPSKWGNRDRTAQARFRRQVLAKDGCRCTYILPNGTRCPVTDPKLLEVHHLDPGNDNPALGKTLCSSKAFGHHRAVDPHAR